MPLNNLTRIFLLLGVGFSATIAALFMRREEEEETYTQRQHRYFT